MQLQLVFLYESSASNLSCINRGLTKCLLIKPALALCSPNKISFHVRTIFLHILWKLLSSEYKGRISYHFYCCTTQKSQTAMEYNLYWICYLASYNSLNVGQQMLYLPSHTPKVQEVTLVTHNLLSDYKSLHKMITL